ncbi:hypothetical protein ACOMHN_057099 [Nucella lapillus]
MTMKCTTLLLPPSSIPPYIPRPSPGLSLSPLPSPRSLRGFPPSAGYHCTTESHFNAIFHTETAALRQRWKHQQQQTAKKPTSRSRPPQSAPPQLATSSGKAMLDLRKRLVAHGYGTSEESDVPLQFPFLEQEVTKRNLTQRLPYHVKLEVEDEKPMDLPTDHPSYRSTFFLPAWGARRPASPSPTLMPRARCLRSQPGQRFFIHPEWSSEKVEWQRFVHESHPTRFRYSWM